MVGRIAARLLAAIAIVAVALSVYVIVHSTVDKHHSHVSHHHHGGVKRRHHRKLAAKPTVYVVKAGDTLSGIASKTGVSVDQLLSLNPNVSPSALQTGQHLRLRR